MATSALKTAGDSFVKVFKESAKSLQKLKKVDPRERFVLLFPSSDGCHVGMGFSLLNIKPAEDVFERANKLLGKDILKMCLSGPRSELWDSLENRNLAAFVTSHATIAKLAHERPQTIPYCKAAGGFGVGIINSLVFSEAMSFENGLDLVQKQGHAMDRAAKIVPNAKVRICIRPATSKKLMCLAAKEHCVNEGIPNEIAICSVTQQKYAHVLEVAGHEEAIKFLETEGPRMFKFKWIKRVMKTSQAFHTDLMRPAKEYLDVYIKQRMREDPSYLVEPKTCSVYSSTAGRRVRTLKNIVKDLSAYPVRAELTEQLIHCMFARPKELAQPNIIVLWDRSLKKTILQVNRLAHDAAEVFA